MKKIAFATLSVAAIASLFVPCARATITFGTSQTATSAPAGGSFNVTLSLNVTQSSNPSNVAGYDVVFEGLATQNGVNVDNLFKITSASPPPSQPNYLSNRSGSLPDALTTTGSDRSGYVQSQDEGFGGDLSSGQSIATPITNLPLGTYTFSLAGTLAPGTYTFDTTVLSTSANRFSDVVDNTGFNSPYPVSNSASFSITVVPEPSTWSLMILGGFGAVALGMIRRRTVS